MKVERNERPCDIPSINTLNRMMQTVIPSRHQGHTIVIDQPKCNGRARKRELYYKVADSACLSCIRLEKFLAGRCIEKKIFHAHRRPNITARIADLWLLASADVYARSEIIISHSREERKTRNRGNGRQRLPTKSERCNGLQIRYRRDFAGRMA